MSKKSNIWINTNNLYSGNSNQNVYRYYFPTTKQFRNGSQIGLQAINVFNSSYNISSSLNNNTFSIIWPTSTGNQTYSFSIQSGYYSESDLNYFLQQCCIQNNLYLIQTSTSNYVYFLEILTNSIQYGVQINSYTLPTSITGYSYPSGAT